MRLEEDSTNPASEPTAFRASGAVNRMTRPSGSSF